MYTVDNTTVVIQGNLTQWTPEFLKEYEKTFKHVIVSSWSDDDWSNIWWDSYDRMICFKPPKPGRGNVNLHVRSTYMGLGVVKTPYVIKVRSDLLIQEPEKWLRFFSEHEADRRIFVLGMSDMYGFSPRDQLFAGKVEDLLKMFDIPYIDEDYAVPGLDEMYPEVRIGLNHCRHYDYVAKRCWEQPEKYLFPGASHRHETLTHWSMVKGDLLMPVSRNLRYYWPKHFPNGYNYDNKEFGEFWYEEIADKKYVRNT